MGKHDDKARQDKEKNTTPPMKVQKPKYPDKMTDNKTK